MTVRSSSCPIVVVFHDDCFLPCIPPSEEDDHLPGLHQNRAVSLKATVSLHDVILPIPASQSTVGTASLMQMGVSDITRAPC